MDSMTAEWRQLLTALGCHCSTVDNTLHVTLTRELDLALFQRHFYWRYIEATHQTGTPLRLQLKDRATKEAMSNQWCDPFMERLMNVVAASLPSQLYEKNALPGTLHPWLLVVFSAQFTGLAHKQKLWTMAISQITGAMLVHCWPFFAGRQWTTSPSPNALSPLISPAAAYDRMEAWLARHLAESEQQWFQFCVMKQKESAHLADPSITLSLRLACSYFVHEQSLAQLHR